MSKNPNIYLKAKDVMANVGNNLTIASWQNNSNSNGSSSSLSLGTSGSKNNSQRDWVDSNEVKYAVKLIKKLPSET